MSVIKEVLINAVKKAVALAPDAWMPGGKPDPLIDHPGGWIGSPVSRVDGPLKVRGAAPFAAEFLLEGMTYAAFAFSTVARGRIATLDTAQAEAAPGVVLVMTHRNAPQMQAIPYFLGAMKSASGDDLPVMQDDRVHWNGQPIATVLAETQEQADDAASLIRATYVAEPATLSFEEAEAAGRHAASFAGEPLETTHGDAEAALAKAAYKVDAAYETPRHNHNALEPHAATLMWTGDELRVHDCTQGVAHTAWSLAEIFGLEEKEVHVSAPFVGGGFGGKALWRHQVLAAAASRISGRPVRVALSREGVYRVVGGRTTTRQRVAIGAHADGRFAALVHTGVAVMTKHNNMPEPFINPSKVLYGSETFLLKVEAVYADMLANTFMRAPGEAVGSFALESAIDELAVAMDLDPIELRIRNEPERDPTTDIAFSSRHLVQAYRDGAERFGWSQRKSTPGTQRDGEWLVGVGMATATYPYWRMPGGAARITLTRDGRVRVDVAAHEMGMGTATAQAQVTASRLGLPMDRVTINYGDSTLPGVILAGGSQQTASVGAAVIAGHNALVKELLGLVARDSPLHGLSVDKVGGRDGGLCKLDDFACHEDYATILAKANREEVSVQADGSAPLEFMHWSMHSYGALFCEARVNAVTGEVRIPRFVGAFDCGRIINPKTAASQFRGGIIMGLGMALMEQTQFDERTGRIMNPSLAEYHVPVHMDVPRIDVTWTDIPDPHTPMGARGIGEIGITGVAAAVANAIYNATGKRVRELPITLDKLM